MKPARCLRFIHCSSGLSCFLPPTLAVVFGSFRVLLFFVCPLPPLLLPCFSRMQGQARMVVPRNGNRPPTGTPPHTQQEADYSDNKQNIPGTLRRRLPRGPHHAASPGAATEKQRRARPQPSASPNLKPKLSCRPQRQGLRVSYQRTQAAAPSQAAAPAITLVLGTAGQFWFPQGVGPGCGNGLRCVSGMGGVAASTEGEPRRPPKCPTR